MCLFAVWMQSNIIVKVFSIRHWNQNWNPAVRSGLAVIWRTGSVWDVVYWGTTALQFSRSPSWRLTPDCFPLIQTSHPITSHFLITSVRPRLPQSGVPFFLFCFVFWACERATSRQERVTCNNSSSRCKYTTFCQKLKRAFLETRWVRLRQKLTEKQKKTERTSKLASFRAAERVWWCHGVKNGDTTLVNLLLQREASSARWKVKWGCRNRRRWAEEKERKKEGREEGGRWEQRCAALTSHKSSRVIELICELATGSCVPTKTTTYAGCWILSF